MLEQIYGTVQEGWGSWIGFNLLVPFSSISFPFSRVVQKVLEEDLET